MGVSLWDDSVFLNSTPGMIWLATTTPDQPFAGETTVFIVEGNESARNAPEQVDTDYIIDGDTAFVNRFRFNDDNHPNASRRDVLAFLLDLSSTSTTDDANPQFTDDAEQNMGLAIRLSDGTVYKWTWDLLVASDSEEPYYFDATSIDNAGDANTEALRNAIGASSSVQSILVDRTNNNIDWDNLRTVSAPISPAAPTLTALTTSIEVTLSSDPTSDATITSRDIQWRTGSGAWTEVTGVTSPHTITGLVEQTAYEVQWRAVSSAGDGAWSPSDSITTAAADLMPSLPAIFSQSATVGTVFSLTFTAATGGDPPLTYTVSDNPAWLTLSNRTLSGTPTAPGTHQVTSHGRGLRRRHSIPCIHPDRRCGCRPDAVIALL